MGFDLSWMAWTWHTATFFIVIAGLISAMGVWEYFVPGGAPRNGILGLTTTRGDRLFVSLLGSAFIHLAWLGLASGPLWWATLLCLGYAVLVFRFV
jgi:predicted small integral membrane protein